MAKNDKNHNQQSPQDILRRIEKQSSQQKKVQTQKILFRQKVAKTTPNFQWWSNILNKFKNTFNAKKKQAIKISAVSQNRHIAIMTVFFIGAIYVSWKIEEKYDKIRARAENTKGIKTRQVELENAYIEKMLKKNPFEPIPIEEEQKELQSYIYEKAEIEFDTKADLLEVIQEQKRLFGESEEQI